MGKITSLQVYMFFAQFLFSSTIGFFISPLVKHAGYMSWVSVILGSLIGLLIAYLTYRLCLRRPTHFLGQYGKDILGRWIHYPLFLIVIFVNLFSAAFITRQFIDFVVQIYLPGTPDWPVAILFGFCVARGVRSGPVALFQSAQGVFFLSILSVLAFPLFASKEINIDMAVALITAGQPAGIWNGTMIVIALFSEMAFIVYLFPYFVGTDKLMKSLMGATATAVVVILAVQLVCLLLFGSELTANLTYPTLEMIRYVHAGIFLENLDPLLIVFWLFSIFLKISLFLLISVKGFAHLVGMNDHKPFSYIMSVAMVIMSINMFKSTAHLEDVTNRSETAFLLFTGVTPVLYYLVDRIRFGKLKKNTNQPETDS
ncbi:endospore germination permease [Paenibacillus illinoisensis]|uniref:GerAB/ArcD/ProY family transporter n=1 Tax=Paenibacillus illinoisensis TaxID=59845 RepID=UPI00301BA5E2